MPEPEADREDSRALLDPTVADRERHGDKGTVASDGWPRAVFKKLGDLSVETAPLVPIKKKEQSAKSGLGRSLGNARGEPVPGL